MESNLGAERLRALGWPLSRLKVELSAVGVDVTEMAISNWRSGKRTPGRDVRPKLTGAPFEIAVTDWDRTAPPSPPLKPGRGRPAPKATEKGSARPNPKEGLISAEALAKDYLGRCQEWREAAEADDITDAQRREYASLERQAIALYARVSGQSDATENQLVRSPQWARLRSEVLSALERHPKAAKDVLAVLERHHGHQG